MSARIAERPSTDLSMLPLAERVQDVLKTTESQTVDIDALFKALDDIRAEARRRKNIAAERADRTSVDTPVDASMLPRTPDDQAVRNRADGVREAARSESANIAAVNTTASAALAVSGLVSLATARKIVDLIASGNVPGVSINY